MAKPSHTAGHGMSTSLWAIYVADAIEINEIILEAAEPELLLERPWYSFCLEIIDFSIGIIRVGEAFSRWYEAKRFILDKITERKG